MDLIDKVLQEKYHYKESTGKEPKYLVLDKDKYLKLKREISSERLVSIETKQTDEQLFGLLLVVTKHTNLEVTD